MNRNHVYTDRYIDTYTPVHIYYCVPASQAQRTLDHQTGAHTVVDNSNLLQFLFLLLISHYYNHLCFIAHQQMVEGPSPFP
jgi:hypothetical protein